MSTDNKDNLAGVAQSIINTPPPSGSAKPGTVVTKDGTRVTLGEKGRGNSTLLSTQKGTNPSKR